MSDDDHHSIVSEPTEEEADTYRFRKLTEEEKASRDAFIASVHELYNAGTPFFTKGMIRRTQDIIAGFADSPIPNEVNIPGFDGKDYPQLLQHLTYRREDEDEICSPTIMFSSFESLTNFSPYRGCPDSPTSVSIGGTLHKAGDLACNVSQDDVERLFDKHFELWEQGGSWADLKEQIQPYLVTLPKTIDKIVAFALGQFSKTWGVCGDDDGRPSSCYQHALMITLARLVQDHTGTAIKCYAQDPAYFNTCKTVLGGRGVEVLQGEDGFLLVDGNSIVLSFSPNIPVRQIITDLARPALMIWNTIHKPAPREWRYSRTGEYWISPYTTDPVSPRVLALREEYVELPVTDADTFRDAAVYVRNGEVAKLAAEQVTS